MVSRALQTFEHAIQDAIDLMNHFDALNRTPPSQEIEVLKRASLVMALAAMETYFEDRILEYVEAICASEKTDKRFSGFFRESLEAELKTFHTPSTDRVRPMFKKYLGFDVTDGWSWNHYDPKKARAELNRLAKKRGDIAHRSLRPIPGQPTQHAVTREDLRKHIHFLKELAKATDTYMEKNSNNRLQDDAATPRV
jgi:RiboL-PSP-HEPN